jgi:hypothetical protein
MTNAPTSSLGSVLRTIAAVLILSSCGSPAGDGETRSADCSALEPSNPYDDGSGHFAGYEWGASGKACGGNSESFIAGCVEHQEQQARYAKCKEKG